ncbi:MAG: hypothetical protein U5K84_11345 [Alkalibacterium sp.]|nr:hypothetical protein [Alkalibacterium sp.]
MTFKWTREAFLVTMTLLTVLFGFYYFGNQYVVEPVRQEADALSQTRYSEQRNGVEHVPAPAIDRLMNTKEITGRQSPFYLLGMKQMKRWLRWKNLLTEKASVYQVSQG